jgi:hypothetical protein
MAHRLLLLLVASLFCHALPAGELPPRVDWLDVRHSAGFPVSEWGQFYGEGRTATWLREAGGDHYGVGTEQTGSGDAVFVVRIGADGTLLWKRRLIAPRSAEGVTIALAGNDGVFALARWPLGSDQVPMLLRIDGNGGERWRLPLELPAAEGGGELELQAQMIVAAAADRAYVAGVIQGPGLDPDGLLVAIDDLGDAGGIAWQHLLAVADDSSDYPFALTVSPGGDVVGASVSDGTTWRIDLFDHDGTPRWDATGSDSGQRHVAELFVDDDASAVALGAERYFAPVLGRAVTRWQFDDQGALVGTSALSFGASDEQSLNAAVRLASGAIVVLVDQWRFVEGTGYVPQLRLARIEASGTPGWSHIVDEPAGPSEYVSGAALAWAGSGGDVYATWARYSGIPDAAELLLQRFDADGEPAWSSPALLPLPMARPAGLSADAAGPVVAFTAVVDEALRAVAVALPDDGNGVRWSADPGPSQPLAAANVAVLALADGGVARAIELYEGRGRVVLEVFDADGLLRFAVEPPMDAELGHAALVEDAAGVLYFVRREHASQGGRVRISAYTSAGDPLFEITPIEDDLAGMRVVGGAEGPLVITAHDDGTGSWVQATAFDDVGAVRWQATHADQQDRYSVLLDVAVDDAAGGAVVGVETLDFSGGGFERHTALLRFVPHLTGVAWRVEYPADRYLEAADVHASHAAVAFERYDEDAGHSVLELLAVALVDGQPAWTSEDPDEAIGVVQAVRADADGVAVLVTTGDNYEHARLLHHDWSDGEREWTATASFAGEADIARLARLPDGRYLAAGAEYIAGGVVPWLVVTSADGSSSQPVQLPTPRGAIDALLPAMASNGVYIGGRVDTEGEPRAAMLARLRLDVSATVFADGFEAD